jgi:hypothetical protein
MKIAVLLDLARQRSNIPTDAALTRRLSKNHGFVSALRKGHTLPSDESLVALCTLANEEPLPWLLALNIERTRGDAQRIYSDLAQHLGVSLPHPAKVKRRVAAE